MDRRLTLYEAYQRQANNRLSDLRRQRLSLILELGATLYPQGKKAFQAGDIRRELMLDQQRSVPAHEHWHLLEMRCVSLLAHILSRDAREEWLGDLQEARRELIASRYTWWAVSLITWGRVVLLGWSLIKIKYQDLEAVS
jgi:hypothetical protein